MECPLCGHLKVHKHGKMPSGVQWYLCPGCHQTFNERFATLYYHHHISPEQIRPVLQAHSEGSRLRGLSRTSGLAYNTGVSIVRAASQRAQQVPKAEVQTVETQAVSAEAMWSFVQKTEAMPPWCMRSRRLLDRCEFSQL